MNTTFCERYHLHIWISPVSRPFRAVPLPIDTVAHLLSDDLEHLHFFATALGLTRSWYGCDPAHMPAYRLTDGTRHKALALGALAIEHADMICLRSYWLGETIGRASLESEKHFRNLI
jgi:hypothetical protein